jgi:hypothetical protein
MTGFNPVAFCADMVSSCSALLPLPIDKHLHTIHQLNNTWAFERYPVVMFA